MQIKISDIPIAKITQQYLDYMQQAAEMNVELSAEFIYMAATLIHIKSKMLLPTDPELEKLLPEEDPRKELVDRLLERERFKSAAEMLHQKRVVEEAVWSNPQIQQFLAEDDNPGLAVTLFDSGEDLAGSDRASQDSPGVYEVGKEEVSVPDMIRYLRHVFDGEQKPVSARELFERQPSLLPRHDLACSWPCWRW